MKNIESSPKKVQPKTYKNNEHNVVIMPGNTNMFDGHKGSVKVKKTTDASYKKNSIETPNESEKNYAQ